MGGPGTVPVSRQSVNKAYVNRGVRAVVENFNSIRKGRDWGVFRRVRICLSA